MPVQQQRRLRLKPNLIPPCRGWQKDLILPGMHSNRGKYNADIGINFRNDVSLEVRCTTLIARGWPVLLGVAGVLISLFLVLLSVNNWESLTIEIHFLSWVSLASSFWIFLTGMRMDLYVPLDKPIRFNRARRKIYAYVLRPNWWMPWRPWPIEVVIYDWTQVRAELWSRGSGGHRSCGTMLSIVEPGTNEVIDRFALNYMTTSEEPWLYVHTYMEKGPDALPPFDTPRDPNELVWYSPFRRWAPKVKWPDEIDLESTTAP